MEAYEVPSCCALQIIHGVDCLSSTNEWSKEEAANLSKYLEKNYDGFDRFIEGAHDGTYVTSSIVLISEHGNSKPEFKRQQNALRIAGMHLICKFPGHHVEWHGKKYWIEMWGTSNMEVASANSRSKRTKRVLGKAKGVANNRTNGKSRAKRALPRV